MSHVGGKANYSLKGEKASRIQDTLFICSVSLVLFGGCRHHKALRGKNGMVGPLVSGAQGFVFTEHAAQ